APADVVQFTTFTAEAANLTQTALGKVSTVELTIIPLQAYSGKVVDAASKAIPGAVVKVLDTEGKTATSGADGAFTLSLPMPFGAHPQLGVSAAGYKALEVNGADYADAAATKSIVLTRLSTGIAGELSGLGEGHRAAVYALCGTERVGPVTVGNGAYELAVANLTVTCSRVWATADGYANAVADNGGKGYDLAKAEGTGVTLTMAALTVDRTGLPANQVGGQVVLTPTQLKDGGISSFGDAVAPKKVWVEIAPDGLDLGTASVASAALQAMGLAGGLTEVKLTILDNGGNALPTSGAGSVVRRLRLTVPFDAARVPLGALESGTWLVYTAASEADYLAGRRTALSPSDLVTVVYVPAGLVTFDVTHLSVFGVEPVAGSATTTEKSYDNGRFESAAGCFLKALKW
ncbi:MAG: carboxypeptidase regulatory-like domain-containing protein, partial [Deferrisomatales bacterium]